MNRAKPRTPTRHTAPTLAWCQIVALAVDAYTHTSPAHLGHPHPHSTHSSHPHTLQGADTGVASDDVLLASTWEREGFEPPVRRGDVNFSEFSYVLRNPLACLANAPCEAQPSGADAACPAHVKEPVPVPVPALRPVGRKDGGGGSGGAAATGQHQHGKRATNEAVTADGGGGGGGGSDASPRLVVVRPPGAAAAAERERWSRSFLIAVAAACTLLVVVAAAAVVLRARGKAGAVRRGSQRPPGVA